MNYQKIYETIIEKRKENIPNGYTETHHIIPRCLGGSNGKDNLVTLTAKEHFICHLLLTKMYSYGTIEYYKMCNAFLMMLVTSNTHDGKRYITSKQYEKLKVSFSKRMSVLQSGKNNSQHGTMWIHNKELQQCKKVPKDSELENGWGKGRILDWGKLETVCLECNIQFIPKDKRQKFCCIKCSSAYNNIFAAEKNRKKVIDENGNIYNSLHEAGIALGITPEGVTYRIKNGLGCKFI